MRKQASLVIVCLAACGDDPVKRLPDGPPVAIDAAIDAAVDAVPDAKPAFPVVCTGMITIHNGADAFAGQIVVGDTVTFEYIYDLALADTNADPTFFSAGAVTAPPTGMRLQVKTWTFQTRPAATNCNLYVSNDHASFNDDLTFECLNNEAVPAVGTETSHYMIIGLRDSTRTIFTADTLPPGAIDVSRVDSTQFSFYGSGWNYSGTLSSCL